jgi:hypothetical protein
MGLAGASVGVASASGSHAARFSERDASSTVSGTNCASGIRGLVTAVTATSVTVKSYDGTISTFTITPTTTFSEGSTTTTASSLVVGDRVEVSASSTLPTTAIKINVNLVRFFGTVTAVSPTTITISDRQGFTRTVVVGPTTTYLDAGVASTLSAVTVGSVVVAQGVVDANLASLDATSVMIGIAKLAHSANSSSRGHGQWSGHNRGGRNFSRNGGFRK